MISINLGPRGSCLATSLLSAPWPYTTVMVCFCEAIPISFFLFLLSDLFVCLFLDFHGFDHILFHKVLWLYSSFVWECLYFSHTIAVIAGLIDDWRAGCLGLRSLYDVISQLSGFMLQVGSLDIIIIPTGIPFVFVYTCGSFLIKEQNLL